MATFDINLPPTKPFSFEETFGYKPEELQSQFTPGQSLFMAAPRPLSLGLSSERAMDFGTTTPRPSVIEAAPPSLTQEMLERGGSRNIASPQFQPSMDNTGAGMQQSPGALENVAAAANIAGGAATAAKAAGLIGTGAAAATTGILATAGAVVPIVGAVAGLIGLGVQWYYASKQRKAEEAAQKRAEQFQAEQVAEEKRRWELNRKLTERQLDEAERAQLVAEGSARRKADLEEYSTKEAISMKKADIAEQNRVNGINQAIQLIMGTMNLFNSEAGKQQNYNFWERRAATA